MHLALSAPSAGLRRARPESMHVPVRRVSAGSRPTSRRVRPQVDLGDPVAAPRPRHLPELHSERVSKPSRPPLCVPGRTLTGVDSRPGTNSDPLDPWPLMGMPRSSASSASGADLSAMRDRGTDRHPLLLGSDDPQQVRSVDLVNHRGLVRVDLEQFITRKHAIPVAAQPGHHRAFLDGFRQAWHQALGYQRERSSVWPSRRVALLGSIPGLAAMPSAPAALESFPGIVTDASAQASEDFRLPHRRSAGAARLLLRADAGRPGRVLLLYPPGAPAPRTAPLC